MARRHQWCPTGLRLLSSPGVGTSIAVLLELLTEPGDGVILQPPVFTGFKPLITRAGREPVRSPLRLTDGRYTMDLADLTTRAADPRTRVMILCNPHNPVGRVWDADELAGVAAVCAEHDVFVIADEIHADLILPPHRFTPFASAAAGTGVRWAAAHGPTKTFGVAGVCDSLLVTDDEPAAVGFRSLSDRFQLHRNNVFSQAAMHAGYSAGDAWLDDFLDLVAGNLDRLRAGLPDEVRLIQPEGTYLAWLDLRGLGLTVPELQRWLAGRARLALSPGHWFGGAGAGFARMTVAVDPGVIDEATGRLRDATASS